MAKRKKIEPIVKAETPKRKEPKLTHWGYQVALWTIAAGLVAQLVMAVLVYPRLPARIPSGWLGSPTPYGSIPSYVVFFAFPGGQIILLLLTLFSPRNAEGKRVMEAGNTTVMVLLTLLFTALQYSAFLIGR